MSVLPAQIVAGEDASAVITSDGTSWVAGSNRASETGLLGSADGESDRDVVSVFTELPELRLATIVFGEYRSAAIDLDGRLLTTRQRSIHSTGPTSFVHDPLPTDARASSVAFGRGHIAVVDTDGVLWVRGRNDRGELGLPGDRIVEFTAVEVPGAAEFTTVVSSLHHTIVLDANGTLWAAGANRFGQLGLGDVDDHLVFTKIPELRAATVSTGENHTAVIDTAGRVHTTGLNRDGQLGLDDSADHRREFAEVPVDNVTQVCCGTAHTVALDSAGNLLLCGDDPCGGSRRTLRRQKNAPPMVSISSGRVHFLAMNSTRKVWVRGSGMFGSTGCGLGDSSQLSRIDIGTERARLAAELRTTSIGVAESYRLADMALR